MGFPVINKFLEEVEFDFPKKKGIVVEFIGVKDNEDKTHSVLHYHKNNVPLAEAELLKFIKFRLKDKLSTKDIDELWDLIEEYGNDAYIDGCKEGEKH